MYDTVYEVFFVQKFVHFHTFHILEINYPVKNFDNQEEKKYCGGVLILIQIYI